MNFHRKKGFALSLAIALAYGSTAFAATVPAGVQLNAKQELVRNNGSEPETLDRLRGQMNEIARRIELGYQQAQMAQMQPVPGPMQGDE